MSYSPRRDAKTRFAEAILYVSRLSEADEAFGATKLNKLLFLSDITSYRRHGRSITDQTYLKMPQGPVPQAMASVREELSAQKRLFYAEVEYHKYKQHRTIALVDPNLEAFNAFDVDILCSSVREWFGRSATEISLYSHEFLGWRAAAMNEEIPLSASRVAALPPTGADIAVAQELNGLAARYLRA